MKMIIFFLILITITLPFSNHPLSMGFNLFMSTILIVMMAGMLNPTLWFSYIFFLIMIGGMLILFIYMTSIASNEKFNFKVKSIIIPILLSSSSMLYNKFYMIKTNETFPFNDQNNLMTMNLKYFTPSSSILMISLMIYLLLTLIMIVKMTKKIKGPLRQK